MKTAILLSGGMDSIAVAWWKRPELAITIDYGQKAAKGEILASRQVCLELGIDHRVVKVDCSSLGSGDMAGTPASRLATSSEWWPFRNQLLVTLAGMIAISQDADTLLLGIVRTDGENHADGASPFISHIDTLMAAQEGSLRVQAPAILYSTTELVLHVRVPPQMLAWAHSCHKAGISCGDCRGCNKYNETRSTLGQRYWND